jgi:hypothetical protein
MTKSQRGGVLTSKILTSTTFLTPRNINIKKVGRRSWGVWLAWPDVDVILCRI